MRVEVTRSFRWARDGNFVVEQNPGDVVEGAAADWALKLQCGRDRELAGQSEAAPSAPASSSAPAPEPTAPVVADAAPTPPAAPNSAGRRRGR
jgi:hypothetical protein